MRLYVCMDICGCACVCVCVCVCACVHVCHSSCLTTHLYLPLQETPKCRVRCLGLRSAVRVMLKPYSRLQGRGRKLARVAMVCAMRAVLVLMAFAIAAPIPHFELVIALVGGLATTIAAFILPPAFHLLLFWRRKSKLIAVLNVLILLFGAIASIITTATTIMQIVKTGPEAPIVCFANPNVHPNTSNVSGYHLY